MAHPKRLLIRRRILGALYDYDGAQDFDTVCVHPGVVELRASVAMLREEWRALQEAEYTLPVSGYDGEVVKLTNYVRRSITENGLVPRDEFLFGPGVFR